MLVHLCRAPWPWLMAAGLCLPTCRRPVPAAAAPQVEVTVMPPQGEPRKRSVGRRFSSFVTLFKRVRAPSLPSSMPAFNSLHMLHFAQPGGKDWHWAIRRTPRYFDNWCLFVECLQLREELGAAVMRRLDPPPRRSMTAVNRK
jgi:hypothetical protein